MLGAVLGLCVFQAATYASVQHELVLAKLRALSFVMFYLLRYLRHVVSQTLAGVSQKALTGAVT